ncbi:Universal stress protein family protein [Geodermatophilus telluris]|uniref:Universal stress protein family protein n=1 Tax=Geodermatophilus telluris TaxID=1190417 RepID=A0A1G6QHU9_9ACTN|nr:Universal stress protein family protein [Geodermatophilus telluris]
MTADGPVLPVVAAYDGSHASVRAAQLAAGAARRRGARLHLLHTWLDVPDRLRARADTDLVTVSRSLAGAGTEVSSSVREGDPVEALRAASAAAQLVVVGHQDGTAHAVAASARCPVVVVPHDLMSIVVRGRRSVVVGVEGSTDADDVLPFAFAEAASRRTDLLAVHAWRERPHTAQQDAEGPFVDWGAVRDREERVLRVALGRWRQRWPDVVVREAVVRERTASVLLAAALTAELLVIGHRRRGPLATRRSTTRAVLHRATGPVAVVPLAPADAS